jgi:hypothetical protein
MTVASGEEHRLAPGRDVEVDRVTQAVEVNCAVTVKWRSDRGDRAGEGLSDFGAIGHISSV